MHATDVAWSFGLHGDEAFRVTKAALNIRAIAMLLFAACEGESGVEELASGKGAAEVAAEAGADAAAEAGGEGSVMVSVVVD